MTVNGGARIVVGMDGSASAEQALTWAIGEAKLRRACVQLVYAWQFPGVALTHVGKTKVPVVAADDLEKAAEEFMHETLDAARQRDPSVEIEGCVQRGHPADALVRAGEGADLLVVGSRGQGGFVGMLLGSVSSHVVQHAPCPVVVVREARS